MAYNYLLTMLVIILSLAVVIPFVSGTEISVQVSTGSDDAEENLGAGSVSTTSSDIELGSDGGTRQKVGWRFLNVDVPQGSNITDAFIYLKAKASHSTALTVNITGEDEDDTETFSTGANNITNRVDTTALVSWETTSWSGGSWYQSINISTIIKEIVDRAGWTANNSMVIMIIGNEANTREAHSYDNGAAYAAFLNITYGAGGGAPPAEEGSNNSIDKDLYVSDIIYEIPRNTSNNNSLIIEDLEINFTIANRGANDTANFNYTFDLNGSTVCSGQTSVTNESEVNISCSWTPVYGFHEGEIRLDILNEIAENDENNSNISVWIPYIERPWTLNLTYWDAVIEPYASNSSNEIAYDSYNFYSTFSAEDFNSGWGAQNVDPRAKKGRENAVVCMINDYNMSVTACSRAMHHLEGWANRTGDWGDISTQSMHELIQVGYTFDLMYPALNESFRLNISEEYEQTCQEITDDKDTNPIQDDLGIPQGGNGRGFGTGIGGFCFLITGEHSNNPSLIMRTNDTYYGYDINTMWNNRMELYLQAGKNDSETIYQEGWLYKWYSQYHLADLLYLFNKVGFTSILNEYQNYIDAMGKEAVSQTLDYTYNGEIIRNDEDNLWRGISRGDTNSYEYIGSDGLSGWAVLTYFALLNSNDTDKEALSYLRMAGHDTEEQTRSAMEVYTWAELMQDISVPASINDYQKFFYDNANDIATWRSNYTYENDTVFQVDGGEERGSGHSQTQGFYLYALGEPFLDYGEVPYEDDIRQESWRNAITFVYNVTADYNENCGDFASFHYYGSSTCTNTGTYPDYKRFPFNYSGDLQSYLGTSDGKRGGIFKYTPMRGTYDTQEFFVLFDDWMIRRIVAKNSSTGQVIDNNINALEEFPSSVSGNNITFNRSGTTKRFDIDYIWANETVTTLTGNTTNNLSFHKTDESIGSWKHYQNITFTSNTPSLDAIRSYTWYYSGGKTSVTYESGNDIGASQGNKYVFFDTDNDGDIQANGYYTDGWSIAYINATNTTMAFNATNISIGTKTLMNSTESISIHVVENSTLVTAQINTYKLANYIDESKSVGVTMDVSSLSNTSNITVQRNGVTITSASSGTLVTFIASTDQNGDTYTITGDGSVPADPSASSPDTCRSNSDLILSNTLVQLGVAIALLLALAVGIINIYQKVENGEYVDPKIIIGYIIVAFIITVLATQALGVNVVDQVCS